MSAQQRILNAAAGPFQGPGLHSGRHARMQVLPAAAGSGIRFVRLDITPPVVIPAALRCVVPAPRRTVLGRQGAMVSTVEHLLAALAGLGIADAEVQLWGAEVPILDGSAAPLVRALLGCSRLAGADAPGPVWSLTETIQRRQGRSRCLLQPGGRLELRAVVDFDHPRVGRQSLRHVPREAAWFARRLAPARTFGFLDEAAALSREALARGASLANVLVFDRRGVLNPGGSRFADEPVRHKLLDALGDLALLGGPLQATVKLVRCGHLLLTSTLQQAIQKGILVRE